MTLYKSAKNFNDYTRGINSYSTIREAEKKETCHYFDVLTVEPNDFIKPKNKSYDKPRRSHGYYGHSSLVSSTKIFIFDLDRFLQRFHYSGFILEIEDPKKLQNLQRIDDGILVDRINVLKIHSNDEIATYELLMGICPEFKTDSRRVLQLFSFALASNNLEVMRFLTAWNVAHDLTSDNLYSIIFNVIDSDNYRGKKVGLDVLIELIYHCNKALDPSTSTQGEIFAYLDENQILDILNDLIDWPADDYIRIINIMRSDPKKKYSRLFYLLNAVLQGYLSEVLDLIIETFQESGEYHTLIDHLIKRHKKSNRSDVKNRLFCDIIRLIEIARKLNMEDENFMLDEGLILRETIVNDSYELFMYMVETGADLSKKNGLEVVKAFLASGNLKIGFYLVNSYIDLNVLSKIKKDKQFPIIKKLSTIRFLIDNGLDPTILNRMAPYAETYSNIEIVEYLHQNGVKLKRLEDVIDLRFGDRIDLDVFRFLAKVGTNLSNRILTSMALFHYPPEFYKVGIENGLDITHSSNRTFIIGCNLGQLDVVKVLIELGADVRAKNDKGIRLGAKNNHVEVVKLLAGFGADIRACDSYPMKIAVYNSYEPLVEVLLKLGVEPEESIEEFEESESEADEDSDDDPCYSD